MATKTMRRVAARAMAAAWSTCFLAGMALATPQVLGQSKVSSTMGGFGAGLGNGDQFGFSVAAIGDFNFDTYGDVVYGAPGDDDGAPNSGAVWVTYLNPAGTVLWKQKISNLAGGFPGVLGLGDRFGHSVASLGDLNGDGTTDIVVGAPYDDNGGLNRGAVWVLLLNPAGGVLAAVKISSLFGGFPGPLANGDRFGTAVFSPGDLNGDGVQDLVVGAPGDDGAGFNRGAVWVLHLTPVGTVASAVEIADGIGGFAGVLNDYDGFGVSLGSSGDLNADGVLDLVVGAPGDDDGGPERGAIWTLFLTPASTVGFEQKVSATVGGFPGVLSDQDAFGSSIASMTDFDGNGTRDLVVGAFLDDDGGIDKGAVWMVMTQPDGTVLDAVKISETAGGFGGTFVAGAGFGRAAASLGDQDLDGHEDLLVGAPFGDDGGANRGEAWSLFLCPCPARADFRTAGANVPSLTVAPPVIGGVLSGSVDLAMTGHTAGLVLFRSMPAGIPIFGGWVVLVGGVNIIPPQAVFLFLPSFAIPIPPMPALCGLDMHIQAVHTGGGLPIALSNAMDTTFGF